MPLCPYRRHMPAKPADGSPSTGLRTADQVLQRAFHIAAPPAETRRRTTMTEISTPGASASVAADALVERLFAATIDTLEVASVYLGSRLGFYRALADGGDATPGELAARTRPPGRSACEWVTQQ